MQYPVVFLPAGHFSDAVLYWGVEVENDQKLFTFVYVKEKTARKNLGTRINNIVKIPWNFHSWGVNSRVIHALLPDHRSGIRCTDEMQVIDDSVPCWIWRNKGISEIL
jgi:hypothetical protein